MLLFPLPSQVADLLLKTQSPPRLKAHLCLVHDLACQLTAQVSRAWPELTFDAEAVQLGSAIHDIGKAVYRSELNEPGHQHEHAGRRLLLEHGWTEQLARFTVTHRKDLEAKDPLEDLLVAVADKVWKGKRDDRLEHALVGRLVKLSGEEPWQVWLTLDEILTTLAEPAAERLLWQASYSL
jgi:HD superfamily phosphodiesterase